MSYDLDLGFKEKPKDLGGILSRLGFKHKRDYISGEFRCSSYDFYQEGKSLCPVEFLYQDKIDTPESWDSSVVSQATITVRGDPGTFDSQKQMEFAKYLRDHYGALLVNSQESDKEKKVIRD